MKERGATMVEYAIILSLIALLSVASVSSLSYNITCAFVQVTAEIAYASGDDGDYYCEFMGDPPSGGPPSADPAASPADEGGGGSSEAPQQAIPGAHQAIPGAHPMF